MATAIAQELKVAQKMLVVTYNVLSSHLGAANYFTHCSPENLDAPTRLKRVKDKLKPFLAREAVICLQEVSMSWSGDLHVFFQQNGYHFVPSLYGSKFNNYMGVAVAYPSATYSAVQVDVARVGDTKKKWVRKESDDTTLTSFGGLDPLVRPLANVVGWSLNQFSEWGRYFFGSNEKTNQQVDEFEYSKGRQNRIVSATLRRIDGSAPDVTVSTYHMPCAFWSPKVMLIHSALAAQYAQRIANGGHLVLAGDFNFKPGDAPYKLITAGTIPEPDDTPDYPLKDSWRVEQDLLPMLSAYSAFNGKEPDFTNFAQIRDEPVFCETLDYIFVSPSLKVVGCENLPPANTTDGPLPTASEPSDHILIAAELEIPSEISVSI